MFATTDPFHRGDRPSPFVPRKSEPLSGTPRSLTPPVIQEIAEVPSSGKKKGVFIFLLVVVLVGVVVGAAAFFLTKRANKNPVLDLNQAVNRGASQGETLENQPITREEGNDLSGSSGSVQPEPIEKSPEGSGSDSSGSGFVNANVNIPPPPPVDRDQDGLTLDQEIQYGTSDSLADTDLDGLSDWEEVQVHHSNPLNPDTDGDGYIDGSEVKKGYSPTIAGE